MNTDSNKQNFIGASEAYLKNVFVDWKPYRIHQVFNWVYHYGCRDFSEMTNLSKIMRAQLKDHFYFSSPKIKNKTHSQDGSIKYLLKLEDGALILKVCGCHRIQEIHCASQLKLDVDSIARSA